MNVGTIIVDGNEYTLPYEETGELYNCRNYVFPSGNAFVQSSWANNYLNAPYGHDIEVDCGLTVYRVRCPYVSTFEDLKKKEWKGYKRTYKRETYPCVETETQVVFRFQ